MNAELDIRDKISQIQADVKVIESSILNMKEDLKEIEQVSKGSSSNLMELKFNFNNKLSLINNKISDLNSKINNLKSEILVLQGSFDKVDFKISESIKDKLLLINSRLDQLNSNPFITFTNTLDFKKSAIIIFTLISLLGGPDLLILLDKLDNSNIEPKPTLENIKNK